MKNDMTIEEKAKAYDEALEKAKEYVKKGYDVLMPDLFPVLRESEDERVRKFLIGEFERRRDGWEYPDISVESILSWLERQKEGIENIPVGLDIDYEENRDLAGNAIGFINIGACYLNNRCRDEVVKWLKSVPDTIKYLTYAVERLKKKVRDYETGRERTDS